MESLETIIGRMNLPIKPPAEPDGLAKDRYYHLSEVPSLARSLPPSSMYSGYGGRVVPKVEPGDSGRSLGFDTQKPQVVSIEAAKNGQTVQLNLANFTDAEVKMARQLAEARGITDTNLIGAVAMEALAELGKQREKKAAVRTVSSAPVRQEAVRSTSGTLRSMERLTRTDAVQPPPPDVPEVATAVAPLRPLIKVLIELPGGGGEHVAYYSDVIVSSDMLILAHDHNRKDIQHVWFPRVSDHLLSCNADPSEGVDHLRAGVQVLNGEEQTTAAYYVFPTNRTFRDADKEYAILIIQQEIVLEAPPSAPFEAGY